MEKSIFKACDIRGIAGKNLTEQESFLIGKAIGTLINGGKIVIAGDVRISTPQLMASLENGLKMCGCEVINAGIIPTPVYYFTKSKLRIDAGVMVTASHNPPEFNGFKPILGKLPITELELQSIRELAVEGKFIDGKGSVKSVDYVDEYMSKITSLFGYRSNNREFRIVVDCGNGCYSDIAPKALKNLGYSVECLFCKPDGTFPNRNPNSAVESNLSALAKSVADNKADIGIAFDGDGDRVSFIDHTGRMVSADKCIVILSEMLLRNNKNQKVIYDLKCSSIVPEYVKKSGGIPIEERSGHTFIKTRMINENALFGGEISGHYFHQALNGGDDGLYTAVMLIDYLVKNNLNLNSMANNIPNYAITPDLRIPYEANRSEFIDKIASSFPEEMISRIDGVKVQFKDGWGLARISVTEPVITMRFEAFDKIQLKRIIQEFLKSDEVIRNIVLSELSLG